MVDPRGAEAAATVRASRDLEASPKGLPTSTEKPPARSNCIPGGLSSGHRSPPGKEKLTAMACGTEPVEGADSEPAGVIDRCSTAVRASVDAKSAAVACGTVPPEVTDSGTAGVTDRCPTAARTSVAARVAAVVSGSDPAEATDSRPAGVTDRCPTPAAASIAAKLAAVAAVLSQLRRRTRNLQA